MHSRYTLHATVDTLLAAPNCSHLLLEMWKSLQAATAGSAALQQAARQCTVQWIAAQSSNSHESELWKTYWTNLRQLCDIYNMPETSPALLGAILSWRQHCLQHPDKLSPGLRFVLTSATGDWCVAGQPASEYQAVAQWTSCRAQNALLTASSGLHCQHCWQQPGVCNIKSAVNQHVAVVYLIVQGTLCGTWLMCCSVAPHHNLVSHVVAELFASGPVGSYAPC